MYKTTQNELWETANKIVCLNYQKDSAIFKESLLIIMYVGIRGFKDMSSALRGWVNMGLNSVHNVTIYSYNLINTKYINCTWTVVSIQTLLSSGKQL